MSSSDAFDRVVDHEREHDRRRGLRRARRVLRVHVWIYVAVNVALIAAWVAERATFDGTHPAWWLPVTVGWGAGLLVHATAVRRPWRRPATDRPS